MLIEITFPPNRSAPSMAKFRKAGNHNEIVLESAKHGFANITKASTRNLVFTNFW